jgi:long-chain acyl-CoA synthetase
MSFEAAGREIRMIAAFLHAKGVRPGDHVGIVSENRIEWCLVYLAVVASKAVIVPIDSLLEPESIASISGMSDILVLFYSEKYRSCLDLIREKAPDCRLFVSLDPENHDPAEDRAAYAEITDLGDPEFSYPEIDPEEAASIIFTSGTTGTAKGVTLSHHGIIANAAAALDALPVDRNDTLIGVLPFHHTYPATCSFIAPFMAGASLTIAEKIIGTRILANIRETSCTMMIGVPLLFDKIRKGMESRFAELPPAKRILIRTLRAVSAASNRTLGLPVGKILLRSLRHKAGLGTLRMMVAGGGPLSRETARFFEDLGFTILQGYGMSENGPLISTNTEKKKNNDSVGIPVKDTVVEIRDANAEGTGEIVVKSPSLMIGYYKNPEATRKVFTEDGYLRTGDLGRIDHKGFLFITGRIKNLIVTAGGKNVYPEEIESRFENNAVVLEVIVTGWKTLSSDEEIGAIVHPDYERIREQYPEQPLTEEFVKSLIRSEVGEINRSLPGYKRIQHIRVIQEPFEKTSSRKIKRYLYTM